MRACWNGRGMSEMDDTIFDSDNIRDQGKLYCLYHHEPLSGFILIVFFPSPVARNPVVAFNVSALNEQAMQLG